MPPISGINLKERHLVISQAVMDVVVFLTIKKKKHAVFIKISIQEILPAAFYFRIQVNVKKQVLIVIFIKNMFREMISIPLTSNFMYYHRQ